MSSRSCLPIALALLLLLSVGGAIAQEHEGVKWQPWGPHVDEIFMPIKTNYNTLISEFERGEIDILPGLSSSKWIDQLKANPNADVVTNYGHHVYYLCFNMRREPLDADAVRQAMAHLVDRDRIVTELLQSSVLPLASFLPPSSSFYKEDVPARSYDPARAAEILDQAGYTVDIVTKTRRDPATRKPMREMSIAPSGSVGPSVPNLIANECRAIGLPVRLYL